MFKITKNAIAVLQTILAECARGPDDCLRIVKTDDGPELKVDVQKPDDDYLERDGRVLLVMDPEEMLRWSGKILEIDPDTEKIGFAPRRLV